jgi:hypothetical protein
MTTKTKVLAAPDHAHQSNPSRLLKIDGSTVTIDHTAAQKAFGSSDEDFINGLLRQLVNVGSHGKTPDDKGTAFVASIVKGIEPQDQIEAMLASQMAAVHMATMTFARRLAHCETIPQQDSAERAFNKLTRTFAAQVEALKKYRTGGQQHVTVKHVTVNEGGQAIVGNVSHGGQGDGKK